jgi:hypothetical protein
VPRRRSAGALAFYRAAANFNGSDELELEITVQGGASSSSTSASMSRPAKVAARGFKARRQFVANRFPASIRPNGCSA